MSKSYRTVLSIAGSDSCGGAGIQADTKTCSALGAYAMTVITAVTAQNTVGVTSWEAVSPALLRAQLEAVLTDVRPAAVKIGMIPDVASVEIIAEMLRKYQLENIVVDPVAVATSGDSLSARNTPGAIASHLFGIATVVTPNIPEAELYLGEPVDKADLAEAALRFVNKFEVNAVLLKGGHSDRSDLMTDTMMVKGSSEPLEFSSPVVQTENSHGTGCSLSSAIASHLAMGLSLREAVARAKQFLYEALLSGADYRLGRGHGPINHLYRIIK